MSCHAVEGFKPGGFGQKEVPNGMELPCWPLTHLVKGTWERMPYAICKRKAKESSGGWIHSGRSFEFGGPIAPVAHVIAVAAVGGSHRARLGH